MLFSRAIGVLPRRRNTTCIERSQPSGEWAAHGGAIAGAPQEEECVDLVRLDLGGRTTVLNSR